jgi:putative transposase
MPQYRRFLIPGGIYFFTVVTFGRNPILTEKTARTLIYNAWMKTKQRLPFQTEAFYLLPDHLHCIWQLPEGDSDYSTRWKEIKRLFTLGYLQHIGPGGFRNTSRGKRRSSRLAAKILGACDSRSGGFQQTRGVHSFQPG